MVLGKVLFFWFEIVFVGVFSVGKFMLINVLLEWELFYSVEGYVMGIECYIEYVNVNEERVVLIFLSEVEIC